MLRNGGAVYFETSRFHRLGYGLAMLTLVEARTSSFASQHVMRNSKERWEEKNVSRYRRNVLDLLTVFGKSAATCHLFIDIDMTWAESQRKRLEELGHRVTVTAILLKAIAIAQLHHPASRTFCLPGSRTVTYNDIVAGFTVERLIENEPIVFFGEIEKPHQKSIIEISNELNAYSHAELFSVNKLRQQVMFANLPSIIRKILFFLALNLPPIRLLCMSATFGLSSLGALKVSKVAGPGVCTSVFGIGAVEQRVVVRDQQIVVRPMMSMSLNFDQRAMDGALAASFLDDVKNLLEGKSGNFLEN